MLRQEVNTPIKSMGLFQNLVLRNHLKSIDATDKQIDEMVYVLYEDEIAVVEGNV